MVQKKSTTTLPLLPIVLSTVPNSRQKNMIPRVLVPSLQFKDVSQLGFRLSIVSKYSMPAPQRSSREYTCT